VPQNTNEVTVRVKICGVTSVADALLAAHLGADAVGLNFVPASPRCVSSATAEQILRALPPFVEPVGVFADVPLRQACAHLHAVGRLHTFQMHGPIREMASCEPYRFIPAFQVREREDLEGVTTYLEACRAAGSMPAGVLVDGHAPGLSGGTGRTAPWDLVASLRIDVPLILAGGLTAENVAEAVRRVRPYAVDVASGVEASPGHKDPEKVRRFIAQARAAAAAG
jgi:phosphoribosylanthranilate isomerase